MFAKDFATMQKLTVRQENERRGKFRFPIRRELKYKLLKNGPTAESGVGETVDMGSNGVGFSIDRELPVGAFIQLSISWPALLDQSCPMRLNVFGRVVRNHSGMCACTIDKYEFRTQARAIRPAPIRNDSGLQRWADGVRKDNVTPIKQRSMTA